LVLMGKVTSRTARVGRNALTGEFVLLKDGRKIYSPPAGGQFSKKEIRAAVLAAAANREKR